MYATQRDVDMTVAHTLRVLTASWAGIRMSSLVRSICAFTSPPVFLFPVMYRLATEAGGVRLCGTKTTSWCVQTDLLVRFACSHVCDVMFNRYASYASGTLALTFVSNQE